MAFALAFKKIHFWRENEAQAWSKLKEDALEAAIQDGMKACLFAWMFEGTLVAIAQAVISALTLSMGRVFQRPLYGS